MTWETVTGVLGGTPSGVSVAWRRHGSSQRLCLVVSVQASLLERIGATRDKRPLRMLVQRNRTTGWIRISVAPKGAMRYSTRGVRWHEQRGLISVPMPDVLLAETKPAQDTPFTVGDKHIEIRLPHWAGTGFIRVAA